MSIKLSIVIPCYNESEDIKENAKKVIDFMKNLDLTYEIILVNDGSKDNTFEVIKSIEGIVPAGYIDNRGKGGAVKEGIRVSQGEYVLIMDADLSTDLNAIKTLIPLLKEGRMIIGSRKLKESVLPVKRTFIRRFISWGCSVYVNMLFHLGIKDTQCGFKLMDAKFAKKVIERQIINRFAFDVEYLYMAKVNDIEIKEIPITWTEDFGSTVKPVAHSKEFMKALHKIKKNKANYKF